MERSQKVEALKDNKLDPTQIKDPVDQLAHAYHLWTTVGAKAKANPNISFTEETKIASNFYDGLLAPIYTNSLKMTPMGKELWMKEAYGEALNYKIENAYGNDWLTSVRHGWNSGLAETARGALRLSTVLGHSVDDAVGLWRSGRLAKTTGDIARGGWSALVLDMAAQEATTPHTPAELGNAVTRGALWQSDHRQFWADAIPSRNGFINKASDFVVEQAAQAPVYASMDLAGGFGAGGNLTARLGATAGGRRALGYLLAGSEGLAYGAAVHKQGDSGEIWRDAVGFTIFHGLFDVGGLGLKKITDVADAKYMNGLKARQDELMLRKYGNKTVDPVEKYRMYKREAANNIAVAGLPGQVAIHAEALQHVAESEKMSPTDLANYEARLLREDQGRWAPVISASKYIKDILGSQKLSTLEIGTEIEKKLSAKLQQLTLDAASEMNTHVKGMQEENEAAARQNLSQPSAKHTVEYYTAQVQKELAKNPGAAALVSPEQLKAAAEKMYAEDLQKAAEHAEKEAGQPKEAKAANIDKRIKPSVKVRSERTVKGKNVSVRYQVEPDYKVRLAQHKKMAAAAGKELKEWFQDLPDKDFEADLTDYFYPKALKRAQVFFENQRSPEGMQNPNFLAFMHNYSDKMPKEFADELKERLINTMKVQTYMSGRRPTEPQLSYYAGAMYNHVDNFLGSGRWPDESNIFRSSNETMFNTTKWQKKLLMEKMIQEQSNLRDAFSGDPKGLRSAMSAYHAFSMLRWTEYNKASIGRNSQELIRGYDDVIADLLTANKRYKKWSF